MDRNDDLFLFTHRKSYKVTLLIIVALHIANVHLSSVFMDRCVHCTHLRVCWRMEKHLLGPQMHSVGVVKGV
jgi:hypothetical protein